MASPIPHAVAPVENYVSKSGAIRARNVAKAPPAPTLAEVAALSAALKKAISDDARTAKEASERVLEGLTPPDGAVIHLHADTKGIRRLRELRDRVR